MRANHGENVTGAKVGANFFGALPLGDDVEGVTGYFPGAARVEGRNGQVPVLGAFRLARDGRRAKAGFEGEAPGFYGGPCARAANTICGRSATSRQPGTWSRAPR